MELGSIEVGVAIVLAVAVVYFTQVLKISFITIFLCLPYIFSSFLFLNYFVPHHLNNGKFTLNMLFLFSIFYYLRIILKEVFLFSFM